MRDNARAKANVLSEMTVPKPVGEIIAAVIMLTVVLVFAILALRNLLDGVALISSSLWLAFLGFIVWAGSHEMGFCGFLVNVMGAFAFKHFIERVAGTQGDEQVRFGFRFLGHRFYYKTISVDKIESVEWHTGQGSHMAGRDMNDWHVGVWFDHGDPAHAQDKAQSKLLKPDQDVYCVGPSDRKAVTTAFGMQLLDLLQEAGIDFVAGEDDTSFVRRRKEEPQADAPRVQ